MPACQRDINIYPTSQSLMEAAATHVVHHAGQAIQERNVCSIALAGGSTPKRLYELLATSPFHTQVEWTKIQVFWGDERHVPPEHADSNYRMADEALLRQVPIPPNHIHRVPGELPDAQTVADRYEAALRTQFHVPEPDIPRFDLILLGMGLDGHTASLFPGTPAVDESRRLVVASWVEQFQAYRITFTPVLLNRARQVTFLISGGEKAETLAAVLEGPLQPHALPAQIIRPNPGHLTWFLDREAAGNLRLLQ